MPSIPGGPPASRKKRIWLGAGVMFAVVVIAFCCGLGIGSSGDSSPQVITTPTPVKVIEYLPAPSQAAPSTATAEPTKAAAATIEEGTWTVGEDFPAGTYRLQTAATSMCYWGIYKSGTNQANIIDNDIVTGGRPTVTLKRGQDFKSDCGTWVKVK
jgi:hypothetical protein